MECFRIDESGYTGFDLLNPEQRFQGATAISITDEDASRLIREHFPRLQAAELKYRALARRAGYREPLISLQRDLLAHHKCVTFVCDKRFVLLLMFADYAIEPWYFARGMDFYADGRNHALASLLYYVGPTLLGKDAFEALLVTFQQAMKAKTSASLQMLLDAARATNWRKMPEALEPLARYNCPDCLDAIATPGVTTDAAIVVLQALISRMEVMAPDPYRVEHDQSKNLLTYHKLIRQLIDHDDKVSFRQSEIAELKFPLKLTEVAQVDSKSSPAVQLADVMIGAAIEAGNTMTGQRAGGLDPEAVMSLYRNDQFVHLVPSLDFEEQKRFRAGTQASEVLDYFARNFRFDR